ncbi:MAG: prephenate dehydrogenase/arogenate dehydrogenase family protein [Verrucomicrobiae bacterium]
MPVFRQDLSGSLSPAAAILGPGLIGGSLAMALRRGGVPWKVSLWTRRQESIAAAESALPGCRVSCDLASVVSGADIVVLCTSPHAIGRSGELLAPLLPPGIPVTDAGSVKEQIVSALETALGGRFIGAHPMAGSEQSGIRAARPDLYDGALCILTPTENSDARALDAVRRLWTAAGCRLHEMPPAAHDAAVARVSHLPHAAAAALVRAALGKCPEFSALAGSGYRDSTRIACGPEDLWAEILLDNRKEVAAGIADLQEHLEALKGTIARGDREGIEAFLKAARILREEETS